MEAAPHARLLERAFPCSVPAPAGQRGGLESHSGPQRPRGAAGDPAAQVPATFATDTPGPRAAAAARGLLSPARGALGHSRATCDAYTRRPAPPARQPTHSNQPRAPPPPPSQQPWPAPPRSPASCWWRPCAAPRVRRPRRGSHPWGTPHERGCWPPTPHPPTGRLPCPHRPPPSPHLPPICPAPPPQAPRWPTPRPTATSTAASRGPPTPRPASRSSVSAPSAYAWEPPCFLSPTQAAPALADTFAHPTLLAPAPPPTDTLGLRNTMSNPNMALTIFVPNDAVSRGPAPVPPTARGRASLSASPPHPSPLTAPALPHLPRRSLRSRPSLRYLPRRCPRTRC
jgi:hypothetical protein